MRNKRFDREPFSPRRIGRYSKDLFGKIGQRRRKGKVSGKTKIPLTFDAFTTAGRRHGVEAGLKARG